MSSGGYAHRAPSESLRREALRNRGYLDGLRGRPKASTEKEYLTSYRRGREQKEGKS